MVLGKNFVELFVFKLDPVGPLLFQLSQLPPRVSIQPLSRGLSWQVVIVLIDHSNTHCRLG